MLYRGDSITSPSAEDLLKKAEVKSRDCETPRRLEPSGTYGEILDIRMVLFSTSTGEAKLAEKQGGDVRNTLTDKFELPEGCYFSFVLRKHTRKQGALFLS